MHKHGVLLSYSSCSGNVHTVMHFFNNVYCHMIVVLNVVRNRSKISHICCCNKCIYNNHRDKEEQSGNVRHHIMLVLQWVALTLPMLGSD